MSITDELRMGGIYRFPSNRRVFTEEELTAIADRIDAEHEAACAEAYGNGVMSVPIALDESAWVELPKDADGEYIHVGDVVVAQLLSGGESKPLVVDRMELSRGRDGDLWCVALDTDEGCWNQPSMLRHHSPTVEDVLEEFAQMYIACNDKGTIAEYAKRLRLVGEDE